MKGNENGEKMVCLQDWINNKLKEIAEKLPTLVHTDPSSFACGFNTGFKSALLELDRLMHRQNDCI